MIFWVYLRRSMRQIKATRDNCDLLYHMVTVLYHEVQMNKFLPNSETNDNDKMVNSTKLPVNADTPSVKKANFVARIFFEIQES